MNNDRKYAFSAGILFIVATVAGVLSLIFSGTVFHSPDSLTELAAYSGKATFALCFIVIMALACAGIAIAMYPVLKRYSPALALGSVGFRVIEGAFHILGVVILLTLLSLSHEFVKAGAPAASNYQTLAGVLLAGRNWAFNVAATMAWCVGALMYYGVFFKTKLVPRWLSVWGLLGIVLAIIASGLILFQKTSDTSMLHTLLNMPIALQEMVLAVWLIIKGFNASPSGVVSGSAQTDM